MRLVRFLMAALLISVAFLGCSSEGQWTSLFDGQDLKGWRASEDESTFRVEDGAIVCNGRRAHLFYVGDVSQANFKNFEFEAEVKTTPGSNSGIYFHTEFQESGWPTKGYECQVLNSNRIEPDSTFVEHKMTGSLYAIRNLWKAPVPDNEWFKYRIMVQGRTIRIWINEELVVDYTEPQNPFRPKGMEERVLSSGTFALQGHDPGSTVYYRNLRVRTLPDDLETPGTPAPDAELARRYVELGAQNFPLMDLHVHLKQKLTLEQALAVARVYGETFGIAVNCGLGMPIRDEAGLEEFLANYPRPPEAYMAMQAEGREWLDLFSPESIDQFDYVFTDSMTWTNDAGKRMRLWIPEETEVGDPQHFMSMLVDRIEGILNNEPIDVYVNPTYLPDEISGQYAELWTEERMDRVISALVKNQIALEINDRYHLPSAEFIRRAKAAGAKFTFGTNNAGEAELEGLPYCLQMISECGLEPSDMWIPTFHR
ncbi:MAG: family 16 glycoside hydrolase [Acidobacteriota bacterium]